MMNSAPLDPARLGLRADPAAWSDLEAARFARAVNKLPHAAAPTALTLGLGPDPTKRTDGEKRLSDVAYKAWKPTPAKNGAVSITNGSSCLNEHGQYAFSPMHGKVSVFRGDDELSPTRSRRPNCARVLARARSGLRGGRPSGRRGAASKASSSSGSSESDSDGPGEARLATLPAATSRPTCSERVIA